MEGVKLSDGKTFTAEEATKCFKKVKKRKRVAATKFIHQPPVGCVVVYRRKDKEDNIFTHDGYGAWIGNGFRPHGLFSKCYRLIKDAEGKTVAKKTMFKNDKYAVVWYVPGGKPLVKGHKTDFMVRNRIREI